MRIKFQLLSKFSCFFLLIFSARLFAGGPDIASGDSAALWTGFYMGGNSGYSWGKANESISFKGNWLTDGTQDDVFLTPFAERSLKVNGYTGGVQAGYNYQIKQWVPGIAADIDYVELDKSYSSGAVTNPASANIYVIDSSFKANWLLTLRPRLGYSFKWFLPYVSGGLAAGYEKYSQTITQQNIAFSERGVLSNMAIGWTVGAGANLALARHWQLMAEYLYIHINSNSTNSVGSVTTYNATHSVQLNTNIVRGGINYVFK